MSLDERAFFTEKQEMRAGRYKCPKCRRDGEYSVRWVRRTKKDRLPAGADERDREKFAKLRDYLLRLDEDVVCKSCGRKFEIPSQQSMQFLDQLDPFPVWKCQVQNPQVRAVADLFDHPPGLGERPGLGDHLELRIPVEHQRKGLPEGCVIFDEKDLVHLCLSLLHPRPGAASRKYSSLRA